MANEKRLIDVNEYPCNKCEVSYCYQNCDKFNAWMNTPVDAVEVVHGRWEDFCRGKMCCCSVCKAEFDNTCNEIHGEWYYCPNCGADMRGDGDG